MASEIASASEEQSLGAGQINDAMGQMNRATQQNASASEELAATAEEMGSQAGRLSELMAFFKISHASGVPLVKTPNMGAVTEQEKLRGRFVGKQITAKGSPALVLPHSPMPG